MNSLWKKRVLRPPVALGAAIILGLLITATAWALFKDSGFETGAFSPNWTVTSYDNNGGLTGTVPFNGTSIVKRPYVQSPLHSAVLGPFAGPQTDPYAPGIQYPRRGQYVARVENDSTGGYANIIAQTAVISTTDIDPLDGKVHVRFLFAPVLDNPLDHGPQDQPYFYYAVRNVSRGNLLLGERFMFSGQPGIPWQKGTVGGNADNPLYLPWSLADVALDASQAAVGDQIQLEIVTSDCGLAGHFGYAYVDDVGSFVDGLTLFARPDKSYVNPGDQITFTIYYRNTSGGTLSNVVITSALPLSSTFVSTTGCTGTGPFTCNIGTLPNNGTGSVSLRVRVGSEVPYGGLILLGDYVIFDDTGYKVLGPLVTVPVGYQIILGTAGNGLGSVVPSPNQVGYAPGSVVTLTATPSIGKFTGWGGDLAGTTNPITLVMNSNKTVLANFNLASTDLSIQKSSKMDYVHGITFTVVARNVGPDAANGAVVSDTMPATISNITWKCVPSGGAVCTSPAGRNLSETLTTFLAGGAVTYTANGTFANWDYYKNVAEIILPANMTDPVMSNNRVTLERYMILLPVVYHHYKF